MKLNNSNTYYEGNKERLQEKARNYYHQADGEEKAKEYYENNRGYKNSKLI